jgi:outer membrane protein W
MKLITTVMATITLTVILPCNSLAQNWFGAATYEVSFPTGDAKDYTNSTSFRGFGLDFRKVVQPGTTAGLFLGWNVFHERFSGAFPLRNGAVDGVQDRYINSFPIMLNAHRYFGKEGAAKPYVGLNAGGFIVVQRFDIGLTSLQKDHWEWGIAPEVGVVIPLNYSTKFLINGKYNYAFTGEGITGNDFKLAYLGLNAGFVWEQ